MCIRDSHVSVPGTAAGAGFCGAVGGGAQEADIASTNHVPSCLLYTSDAADERSSVDLGGRRIIKKKKIINVY